MKAFLSSLHNNRTRRALLCSVIDGILWATMFGFAENFIVPFVLFMGATAFYTSLMQGGAQLAVAMAQLAGSRIVHALKRRRVLSVVCTTFHALSFLAIPVIAILTKNFWIIIITFTLGTLVNNIASPGWISWMNDLIPQKHRGTFWGLRNMFVNFAQFGAIIIAGTTLHVAEGCDFLLVMYVILFGAAGFSRMGSTIPLSKQYEPKMAEEEGREKFTLLGFLSRLVSSNFGRFAVFSFSLTFTVNPMVPVIPVFLLTSLDFNYIEYSIIILAPMVTTILAMRYWGKLADKYGNYRILLITAVLIPLFGFAWAFIKNMYLFVLLQLLSGFVWSGFNLSNQNYLLDSVRPQNVPKIFAYFISINNICAFAGSITGGFLTLITREIQVSFFAPKSFELIFLLSGFLRIVIVLLLIKSFKEVREVAPSPRIHYFYFTLPMLNIYNRIVFRLRSVQKKKMPVK
jgi:MFS family permease